MAGSLQDQLLNAGLIKKDKAKEISKAKRKEARVARNSGIEIINETKEAAKLAAKQKAERDRELNANRNEVAHRKAINAQIKQLIENHRQPRDRGDVAFNFTDGSKIKKIYINAKQQNQLSNGMLSIVKQADQYELIPSPIANKIAQRDASRIIDCREKDATPMTAEEEEWYKDYEIPDDLMW